MEANLFHETLENNKIINEQLKEDDSTKKNSGKKNNLNKKDN